MPSSFFVLLRSFVRVDGVCASIRDHRYYHKFTNPNPHPTPINPSVSITNDDATNTSSSTNPTNPTVATTTSSPSLPPSSSNPLPRRIAIHRECKYQYASLTSSGPVSPSPSTSAFTPASSFPPSTLRLDVSSADSASRTLPQIVLFNEVLQLDVGNHL